MYDYVIFGGGVVGAAIFNKFVRLGAKVALLEKELDVATGASKANSGLVHAGFDAETGTLKAKLNVRGNELFEKLCQELGIKFKRTGALVVGNDEEKLKELLARGKKNGVKGLSIIREEKLWKLVPNLRHEYKSALYAKTAGLVSPYMLTIALAEEAVINGGQALFGFTTKKIEKAKGCFKIYSSDKRVVEGKVVINATGAGYNDIARLLKAEEREIRFRRGEYYVLDKCDFVNLTVFPLPTKLGKGILATPTASGNILLGPTAEDILEFDTATTMGGLENISGSITAMFDNVPFDKIIREYSGVRVSCGDDFVIGWDKKAEGVVDICGINSPGLTSAPAIAEMVAEMVGLRGQEKKMIRRKGYAVKVKGEIVCRCEKVGKNEILSAINSPLKPCTVDGIKRRVRAGMGKCQGGYCLIDVCCLIARERGIKLEEVNKEHEGGAVMLSGGKYE